MAHCKANLAKTFSELLLQYEESSLHVFTPGHKTTHIIDDLLSSGHELMEIWNGQTGESIDISDEMEKPEFGNVVIELF